MDKKSYINQKVLQKSNNLGERHEQSSKQRRT
jgi:hypothetical protein